MRFQILTSLIVCCSITLGCNAAPDDQPDVGLVQGTVTLDDKPLEQATVTFQPAEGRPSLGVTDAAGHYELTYTADTKGAKLGPHTVAITTYRAASNPQDPTSPPFEEILPAKYNSRTELTADVKAGENKSDFPLKSK